MSDNYSFSQLLRKYRKARDLTQEQLAEIARVSPETIRKIENGIRRANSLLVEALANALELTPEERSEFLRLGLP